jgi:hypothetical protein
LWEISFPKRYKVSPATANLLLLFDAHQTRTVWLTEMKVNEAITQLSKCDGKADLCIENTTCLTVLFKIVGVEEQNPDLAILTNLQDPQPRKLAILRFTPEQI